MHSEVVVEATVSGGQLRGSGGYWLIVGQNDVRKTLTLCSRPCGETLPIFGSEEDANAFLRPLGTFGTALAARPIAAKDLASLLSASLFGVRAVALDPSPEMDTGAVLGLISMERGEFVEKLKGNGITAGTRDPATARGGVLAPGIRS